MYYARSLRGDGCGEDVDALGVVSIGAGRQMYMYMYICQLYVLY